MRAGPKLRVYYPLFDVTQFQVVNDTIFPLGKASDFQQVFGAGLRYHHGINFTTSINITGGYNFSKKKQFVYTGAFAKLTPPVGQKVTCGNGAPMALSAGAPPAASAGKNFCMS